MIDALELLSADQVGAKAIAVEANGELSVLDKFTVKKGSTEVTLDGTPVLDGKTATINLVDKIVADAEYTVTLTPADGDGATSVTFVGEKAELIGIEFMTDKLVMKDYHYAEGYTYVKGVDQYGDPVNLSGLTVTPGVGTFKSYDSNTGKITLYDDGYDPTKSGTGAFLLVQQVPVYVQYQSGSTVFTANETLTVSTAAYVDEIEFGDIKKDGGNERPDKRLTVTELSSGKYYVELNKVLDNYGNTLSAEDLNKQKDDSKTLFVIPGTTGAFYTTGDFGEVGGKTVLWITNGIRKGTMDLSITGAGGRTFKLPIEVEDDPFIQTLTVVWPELYEGMAESAELEFSAVDQYGNTLSKEDLWNIRPIDTGLPSDEITFTDPNSMTTLTTTVKANGKAVFNPIKFDYANKEFTVTLNAGACVAKEVETFTVQTAGMDVVPKQITVGNLGYAAKIKSSLKAGTNTQLVRSTTVAGVDKVGREDTLDFNKALLFEDANGNEMVRGKSEEYPAYMAINNKKVNETIPKASEAIWKTGKYVWSLTDREVEAATTSPAVDYTNGVFDADTDFGNTAPLGVESLVPSKDVYATLYLADAATAGAATQFYKLDQKKFHITQVTGNDKSYSVVAPGGLLYATPDSGDTAEFKVKVTTDQGETYTAAADRTRVVTSNKFVASDTDGVVSCGDTTEFDGGTSDTLKVTVYCDGKEVGESTVDYSNKTPVPTKVKEALSVDAGDCGVNGDEKSRTGADGPTYDNGDFVALGTATYTIDAKGVLTITDANDLGDTLKRSILDQYDQSMPTTGWFLNGEEIKNGTTVPNQRNVFEFRNGNVGGKFYLTDIDGAITVTVAQTTSSLSFTGTELNAGDNSLKYAAAKAGTIWAMTNAAFTAFKEAGVEPTAKAGVINVKAVNAQETNDAWDWAIDNTTGLTANTAYQLVLTDGDGGIQAQTSVKTAAAVLTSATAVTTAAAFTSGTTVLAGMKDQFGNNYTGTGTLSPTVTETIASTATPKANDASISINLATGEISVVKDTTATHALSDTYTCAVGNMTLTLIAQDATPTWKYTLTTT